MSGSKISTLFTCLVVVFSFMLSAFAANGDSYLILLPLESQSNGNSRLISRACPELEEEFRKIGIDGRIGFCDGTLTAEKLSHYNVVVFGVAGYAFQRAIRGDNAVRVGKLLQDYVKDGGGLLVMRNPGYQFDTEIQEINEILLKPLGAEILPEQMWDTSADNTHYAAGNRRVYWTNEIVPHPVTEGVKGLFYPDLFSPYHRYTDFSTAIKVNDDWKVLAYGSKTGRTYHREKGNEVNAPGKGSFRTRPPFLAIRDYGKGRIALMPVASTLFWHDPLHPFWKSGNFAAGNDRGYAGDNMRLTINLMDYLRKPSSGKRTPEAPDAWQVRKNKMPEGPGLVAIDWSRKNSCYTGDFLEESRIGLVGAQSSLSSGQGTPEEFIAAARKAGYNFIAFAEEFSKMTPQKFDALKKICAAHSKDGFFAYPGFSIQDEAGNSWVTFSNKITWPPAAWMSKKFPARMSNCNPFSRGWNWPPMILVNSKSNNDRPFFRGNYKMFAAWTYRDGKLVDSSFDEYLRLAQDGYHPGLMAVHFVTSPEKVKLARAAGFQQKARWFEKDVLSAFAGNHCMMKKTYIWTRPLFVTEAPEVLDFRIYNFGDSDLAMRGLERWRLHLRVASDSGIKSIEIFEHEESNIWRRFLCNGQKLVDMQIDGHHSRKNNLVMRVTDVNGKQAVSWQVWTGLQENQFGRCSDNLNTMPRGKWWGTPKNQQNVRGFEDFSVGRELSYCGTPFFPELGDEGTLPAMEYRPLLVNRFVSVVDCIMEGHWSKGRHPNLDSMDSSFPTIKNKHYKATVRYTIFTGRQEGAILEKIDGKVKVLDGFTAWPRIYTNLGRMPKDLMLSWMDASGKIQTKTPVTAGIKAEIGNGGFAALYPDPFKGSVGVIPFMDGMTLETAKPSALLTELHARHGEKPVTFNAGDEFSYSYLASISSFNPKPELNFVTDVIQKLGIGGKTAYSVKADIGSVVDTKYILRLQAKDAAFSGKFSQAELPIDLPVIISGLNPKWDAVVWYRGKNKLMIPWRTFDDYGLGYVERAPRDSQDEIRFFGILGEDGYLQIDTELGERDVFIGNPVQTDCREVMISLCDCAPGKLSFEVHNPTDKPVKGFAYPAKGFTLMGDFRIGFSLEPGSSVILKP